MISDWGLWNPLRDFFQLLSLSPQLQQCSNQQLVITFSLHVSPGGKKEKIVINEGLISWKFSAQAREQMANRYVLNTLGKRFGVGCSNVAILRGEKSRDKLVRIIFSLTDHKNVNYYLSKVQAFFPENL